MVKTRNPRKGVRKYTFIGKSETISPSASLFNPKVMGGGWISGPMVQGFDTKFETDVIIGEDRAGEILKDPSPLK